MSLSNNSGENITEKNNAPTHKSISPVFIDPNIQCLLCGPHSKEPVRGKPVRYFSCANPIIKEWVVNGGNVGATSLTGFAVFIDGDTIEIQKAIEGTFSKVFKWSTGRESHYQYAFFTEDKPFCGPIPLRGGAYVKTKGGYVLIDPSIHPNGRRYGEITVGEKIPVVKYSELYDGLSPFFVRSENMKQENPRRDHTAQKIDVLNMADVVDLSKLKRSGRQFQGPHPIHGSETGQNFTIDLDLNAWHCFRHGTGGGPLQWIAVREGIISCEEATPGALRGMKFWETIAVAHDRYGLEFDKAAKLLEEVGK